MLDLVMTSQFKKDIKRVKKRGLDLSLLSSVLQTLSEEIALDPKYRDHALAGNYIGFRECHSEPLHLNKIQMELPKERRAP